MGIAKHLIMCGIVGKIYSDLTRCVEAKNLQSIRDTLIHRGPDGNGLYVHGNVGLGMCRLSIIDLERGHQPIHNEDRTIWTVYNGEIYNFRELRRDLQTRGHRFYTHTDSEVIVHLYEEYGLDFVRQLNGMFAIALWDENEHRLVLVRDHLGIKPLYYCALPDRFLFGSEIKAILADAPPLTLDMEALSIYLSLLYIPAPHTIYQEIRKLEPGHLLVLQNGRITSRQYWHLEEIEQFSTQDALANVHNLQGQLRDLMTDSVKHQLVADVPLGIFLSGGMDSSTVVALARETHNGPLKTFAVGFDHPSYNEIPDASIVAKHFGTDHTELVVRPNAADLVPKLVECFDEPFADSSAIPVYYLSQLTREHVTVALGGDGGDEIFAGYVTYQADKLARIYNRLPGALSRWLIPGIVHRLPVSDGKVSFDLKARRFVDYALLEPGRRHYAWKAFFSDDLKEEILFSNSLGHYDGYQPYQRHYESVAHLDEISRFQYADTKVYLPDNNLVKVDRMSMAHSLEVRVPLLDYRVVEFMFKLPNDIKMPGLKLKHFMKDMMRGILPQSIINKRKGGFNVPMSHWLKTDLRPLVDIYLAPKAVQNQGFFCPEVITRLVENHMAGRRDYSRNLWALLVFNLWVERASVG